MRKIEIRVEPNDVFFERSRRLARLADRGGRIPHSRIVSFEDVRDLLAILTEKRLQLLQTLKETPGSITDLAKILKRDRSAVTRDIQILERYGIIEVREKPLP